MEIIRHYNNMKTKLLNTGRTIISYFIVGIICCIVIITVCIVCSGSTNEMYFNIETQEIIGCRGTISNLYLISKDGKDEFNFTISQGKKSSKIFSIRELNKDYSIKVTQTHIDLQHFKLRPNTEYEIINHSNGDTPDGKLIIRTDQNSTVIYADKTSCK